MTEAEAAYRLPQQQRSKDSLERILDAAESLIRERGFDAMTVAEVVQRSGSSVGSLYARFRNKRGLLRAVQVRYQSRLEEAMAAAFREGREESLPEAAHLVVKVLADHLLAEHELFRAFIVEAVFDPVVRAQGEKMSGGRREFVTQALLAHRDEIAHPHPELAARWCYTLCMAVLRERMTFGEAAELAGGFADETVITELSRTVTGYLMSGTANDDAAGSLTAGPQDA
jgi:AcrR family transcriptional regulator